MPDLDEISIHAPAKGATAAFPSANANGLYFNPRSREGSDESIRFVQALPNRISIHAPAKGATKSASSFSCFF